MRKLTFAAVVLIAAGFATDGRTADKVRLAYTVQIHQANMMALRDYASKHGVELEPVPMRRYADQQLALMTNQVDVAVVGYINLGLWKKRTSVTIGPFAVCSPADKI
jgi:ABC-type metal ion transport system substrate-binding protein